MKYLIILLIFFYHVSLPAQSRRAAYWLTTSDRTRLFQLQQEKLEFGKIANDHPSITVDEKQRFQTMDGFGFSLTGGSALHIIKMTADARKALLHELFTTGGNNIGVSYLRLSIGASDLNEKVFTYDDLPEGETDPEVSKFDLGPDRADVIPVMKEILSIYPSIKILGSPWSPPAWMKTIHDSRGGRLKHEYFRSYAFYLVKYILSMKKEGIHIDAITVQNERLHPGNNPSMLMTAPEEADFIKNYLGPSFAAAHIKAKIILYDHNADRPDYPITILDDTMARKYINGSGFHLYGGSIEALQDVHAAHPDKQLYFTEQMVVDGPDSARIDIGWPISVVVVGATRNWCKNVLLWNLAADPQNKPYTDRGGCDACQGAVTIDGDKVTRNLAYYSIAHVSKLVRPGSVRIGSTLIDSVSNVAFRTPAGKIVFIAANDSQSSQAFNIVHGGQMITCTLPPGAAATYTW